jgi:capsular polysaccharide biosynthesis protein
MALAESRLEDAALLASALEAHGGRTAALLDLRAKVAIRRGEYDTGVALYTEALRLDPDDPGLYHALALIYSARQQWDLAANAAKSARQRGLAFEAFVRNLRIECTAYYAMGEQGRGRGLFASVIIELSKRKVLKGILQSKLDHADLLASAMAAGNMKWVESLFQKIVEKDGIAISRVGVFPIASLSAWCEEHGAAIEELDPVQSISVAEHGTSSESRSYDTDPYRVASVPNAEFVCGWDFVITPTGHLLKESGYWGLKTATSVSPHFTALDSGLVAHDWPEEVQEIDADALFLSAPESFHIGHWIVDFLPRLRAILGTEIKVAAPSALPKKHRQFLALVGVGEDRIIGCELGRRYRFRNLIIAQTGDYLRPIPSTVAYLRRHLALDLDAKPRKGTRIFLERGIGTRKIENRQEFEQLLAAFDFQIIDLSKMSVAEQRSSLASVETLLGVFGSDLICSYFAPPGANVIEMIWDPGADPYIGAVCHLMGIHHQFLVCEEAAPEEKRWKKDRDLRVDCDLLRRRLADITAKNA